MATTPTTTERRFVRRCQFEGCGREFAAKTQRAMYGPCCLWKSRRRPLATRTWWTPERDAVLRAKYTGRRGNALEIARAFGWPDKRAWMVKRRAADLCLTRPRDARLWTKEETAFLLEHVGAHTTLWISRRLRRSVASVAQKCKAMELARAVRDGYTLRALMECFGVGSEAIERWIRRGYLKGKRRNSGQPDPNAVHDPWHFSDADVLRFIREHPTEFRLGWVDQLWFLDLVFQGRIAEKVA